MENRYKQLEQDVSALSSVISQLGARLSDAAKDATASGMLPSEKLIEQIQAARVNFENVRGAVHGQAAAMLVSPLPKVGELMSIASLSALLKSAAAAEEGKASSEAEREKALAILTRVLGIAHRETPEFKPLQECHAKINELKTAIAGVAWPNRHPELDSVLGSKHASCSLLDFVENLDTLEDEKWMSLEATITGAYGKPLFVAASRGKLVASAEKKAPVEKPAAPAAPTASVEKKVAAPPAPAMTVVEKKEMAPEPTPQRPPAPAPSAVVEKKEAPIVVPSAQPASPAPATPAPSVAPVPAAPSAVAAQQTPTVVDAPVPARPPAPVPVVAQTPTPAPAQAEPVPSAGSSLSALATATDPAKAPVNAPGKDPRLTAPPAAPQPVPVPKVETKPQDSEPTSEELQKAMAGDGAQRPQRWGFWRGNR